MSLNDLEKVLSGAKFNPQSPPPPPVQKEEERAPTKGDLLELERKLSQQNPAQQDSVLMNKIMSDPDISKILKARQEGKQYKVLGEDEIQSIDPIQKEQINKEDLSDPEKLSAYLVQQVAPQIKNMIAEELAPLKQDNQRRQQRELVETQTHMEKRIKEVKDQHPDFDDMLPKMRQINERTKGTCDPAELYIMAKLESGEVGRSSTETESERPTTDVTRQTLSQTPSRGSRGLEASINSAFDRASSRSKI